MHNEKLESLIAKLENELKDAIDRKAKAIARAQLTRSGHVYILSNVGTMGEGVYKIGMTRRFEPMERIKELGDASVPFPFDVHALIYSEDAPKLENSLHRHFADRRLNLANYRKEYFRVTLDEVRGRSSSRLVKSLFDSTMRLCNIVNPKISAGRVLLQKFRSVTTKNPVSSQYSVLRLGMKTLKSIKKALVSLRAHPEPDQGTFEEAATLLRMANDLAVVQGIKIEPVGALCGPADALATVSKYIASVPTDTGYLTATALARVLGCRRPSIMSIMKHLRAGRIPAINISISSKPNYRFCLESVKAALAAKPATKSTRKQAPTKPFLV